MYSYFHFYGFFGIISGTLLTNISLKFAELNGEQDISLFSRNFVTEQQNGAQFTNFLDGNRHIYILLAAYLTTEKNSAPGS
jgi:hypothetical protein